jgi:hypothetical protein
MKSLKTIILFICGLLFVKESAATFVIKSNGTCEGGYYSVKTHTDVEDTYLVCKDPGSAGCVWPKGAYYFTTNEFVETSKAIFDQVRTNICNGQNGGRLSINGISVVWSGNVGDFVIRYVD